MITELVSALLAVTISVTKYETKQVTTTTTTQGELHQEYANKSKGGLVKTPQNNSRTTNYRGYVSTYTATYGGCLGCFKYYDSNGQLYYKMANGERLDDRNYTIAFNHLPLGTHVSLVNLSNSHSVAATVTDRGGFEECCNRIADLSLAVATSLGTRTDKDLVEIKIIE